MDASQFDILPPQASTFAWDVDLMYLSLVGISVFFSVLIFGLLIGFAIKFRRRSDDEVAPEIEGSLPLELVWTAIPLVIVLAMFAWGARLFFVQYQVPEDAMEIYVTGKQWMWKVQHPSGKREINHLHVPKGRPVKLVLTSEDVIHSFYVPAFRNKKDAVPGRFTTTWFQASEVGTFHLFCAEYCGTDHSKMKGWVTVMEPEAYEAWLTQDESFAVTVGGTPAEQGEALFGSLGCKTCHSGTSGALGPNLVGVFGSQVELQDGVTVEADENYLRESILNAQAKIVKSYEPLMPLYQGQINEEKLQKLVAYIKSLGPENTAAQ